MKLTCSFSYSWNDTDINILDAIKNAIERKSKFPIDVIYDRHTAEPGDNLDETEKKVASSDVVVMFCTPSYKTKTQALEINGVYREYHMIKQRLENEKDFLIPILLKGEMKESVPNEISKTIYADLKIDSFAYSESKGKIVLSNALKIKVDRIAERIIGKAFSNAQQKTVDFTDNEEELRQLLFDRTHLELNEPFPSECLVEMDAYSEILEQRASFVIGRKGAGKTTLLNTIQNFDAQLFHSKYKNVYPISIEMNNLLYAYQELGVAQQKDFSIIPLSTILDVFWEIFLTLQCVKTIQEELINFQIPKTDIRYKNFKKVTGILSKKTAQEGEHNNLFVLAVEMVSNYLRRDILNKAREEFLVTSVVNHFTSNIILEDFFGKRELVQFCKNIQDCEKKIFISLDGFDTISDDFRRKTDDIVISNPEEYRSRNEFEILFYRQLMLQISKIKNKSKPDCTYMKNMFSAVHFCVIIPQDRFDEIRASDRDIAKRVYCTLSWDAHDLLEMLVKRLEYIHKDYAPHSDYHVRFSNLLSKYYPYLPLEIPVEIDGVKTNISLFNYILRFSFWRPRDIILNFASLMHANKKLCLLNNRDINRNDVIELVKDLIKDLSRKIIEDEFIDEYKYTYRNLSSIINSFEGEDLVMNAANFCSKIAHQPITYTIENDLQFDEKVLVLYRLGVIGVYYGYEQAKQLGRCRASYVFNEGLNPIDEIITKKHLQGENSVHLIFNPVFQRYLEINMNTRDVIGNYSQEYVLKNHLRKDSIRRL